MIIIHKRYRTGTSCYNPGIVFSKKCETRDSVPGYGKSGYWATQRCGKLPPLNQSLQKKKKKTCQTKDINRQWSYQRRRRPKTTRTSWHFSQWHKSWTWDPLLLRDHRWIQDNFPPAVRAGNHANYDDDFARKMNSLSTCPCCWTCHVVNRKRVFAIKT